MAIRRLRIRRGYCLGLLGNLQLPSESLWVVHADTQAASHTAASAVRSALAHVSSGTRVNSRVPVTCTAVEEIASSSESWSRMSQRRQARVAFAVISKLSGPRC